MSQSNGITTATIVNHKININDDDNNSIDLRVLQNLEALVPDIKKNLILTSQQFTEFINYTKEFEKLASTIRTMKIKQDQLKDELEQYKRARENVEKQMEINSDRRIYLDVGGQYFTTTIKTLTQKTNSLFFQTLIDRKWDINTNSSDNPIFIDRDGRLFDLVLKYLRTGELNIDDKTIQKELLIEAKYYQLKALEDELTLLLKRDELMMTVNSLDILASSSPPCSPMSINKSRLTPFSPPPVLNGGLVRLLGSSQIAQPKGKLHPAQTASSWRSTLSTDSRLYAFVGSVLLTTEYEEKLLEFIGDEIPRQTWQLIYRASEHGYDASDFHRHCDSHAPTISIIQSDFGNIFGGFTSVPWSSAALRSDQADPKAFLFTLKNALNIPPTKFPIAKEFQQCAISHNPTCGPNFGSPKNEGSDLCLRNKFNDKNNCVFFPKSYTDSTNQGGLIFAKKYFACKEVEVFTLTLNS